jgi:formiminoglutamase
MKREWLHVAPGDAPLIVSIPHAGTDIPPPHDRGLASPERARRDADLYLDRLYGFAADLGATIVRTDVSRTVIDMNRDPSGVSLYPGQATTGLCPTISFDDEPLYEPGLAPDEAAIAARRTTYFEPYHEALAGEIARLRGRYGRIVLYEAHSIRSRVPMLFDGLLPELNIGTNGEQSCASALARRVESVCAGSGRSWVTDGRFRGGWTTRHYGHPAEGVHALQMEMAMRVYLDEDAPWPPAWDDRRADAARALLRPILNTCIGFAKDGQ